MIQSDGRKWVLYGIVAVIALAICRGTGATNAPGTNSSGRQIKSPARPTSTRGYSPDNTQPKIQASEVRACVTASQLNVREGPGTQYRVVGGVPRDECIKADARDGSGGWLRIKSANWWNAPSGGWVSADYLAVSGSSSSLPVRSGGSPIIYQPTPTNLVILPTPDYVLESEPTSAGGGGGPTALCWDGTYSYSQHRRGTCSWHGGVREWLRDDIPP